MWAAWMAACVVASQLSCARGFYIPGVAPTEYHQNERLEIKVIVCTCTRRELYRMDGREA